MEGPRDGGGVLTATPPCPRCGKELGPRDYSVQLSIRCEGCSSGEKGCSIKVCKSCAFELRDQVDELFAMARAGVVPGR